MFERTRCDSNAVKGADTGLTVTTLADAPGDSSHTYPPGSRSAIKANTASRYAFVAAAI